MSVAEKLKALDAEFPNKITAPTSYALVAALPQIVAVVEAAERLAQYPNVNRPRQASEARDALAALDEALS